MSYSNSVFTKTLLGGLNKILLKSKFLTILVIPIQYLYLLFREKIKHNYLI